MQKVSKQSLAMLALSILLAISIALTFTFAGLYDSKTAKGTITFSGSVGLIMQYNGSNFVAGDGTSGNPYTFEIAMAAEDASAGKTKIESELAKVTFKLSDTSQAAYIKVTASSTNNTGAVQIAASDSATNFGKEDLVWTSDKAFTTTEATSAAWNLSKFYTVTYNPTLIDADATEISITFTIEADTTSGFTHKA